MKRVPLFLVALTVTTLASTQTPATDTAPAVKYGANAAAGGTFVDDGVDRR